MSARSMVECPRCGSEVDELHFLPPEVITREILASLGGDDGATDHETCESCIGYLMEA